MMRKPVAVVLGGTLPHIHLIELLKTRGYYTLLIDFTENPPAKTNADEHIQTSTLDKEAVLAISRERGANLVISTNVDQANVTCCYVAEKLGLPHPYSYETALNVTDKKRMKRIMLENGIPTARYFQITSVSEVPGIDLNYPLIVKPADSNSANGVSRVDSFFALEKSVLKAQQYSRSSSVIVEEFVEGVEISAYSVVIDGMAKLLMHQERMSVYDGEEKVIKCYASFAPSRISEKAIQNAESILTDIARTFHLNNTPLFFQGIVRGDEIKVIEFAPRVGGGISSQTMLMATGYDIISSAIDSFLEIPIRLDGWHPMKKKYVVNQIYGKNGTYDKTIGGDILLKDGTVDSVSFYKHKGDLIDVSRASSSRIGVIVVSSDSEVGLRKKISRTFSVLDSFDDHGRSIFRRDLNLDSIWQ